MVVYWWFSVKYLIFYYENWWVFNIEVGIIGLFVIIYYWVYGNLGGFELDFGDGWKVGRIGYWRYWVFDLY